jgi:hypothetical protein
MAVGRRRKKNRVLSEVVSGEPGPLEEPVVCRRVLASRSADWRDRLSKCLYHFNSVYLVFSMFLFVKSPFM